MSKCPRLKSLVLLVEDTDGKQNLDLVVIAVELAQRREKGDRLTSEWVF